MSVEVYARTVMKRCAILGGFSEEPGRLTRRFATPAMQQVNTAVAGWMRAAGMTVHVDNIGNLIGRYDGTDAACGTLLLGSHLDSVRDAGRYDGPLGVLVALACVQRLHDRGERLPFGLEIVAFADEEGVRYHTAYLGSSVFTGTFDPAWLDQRDDDGIAMRDAIRSFGGDPDALTADRRTPNDLIGYVEVHIEQGPVLEAHDLPVGVVTAIQGQSRFNVSFAGTAGHAGTVPMALRHDALVAAAAFVLAVQTEARQTDGLVATVGQLAVQPGASNVIPGRTVLSLDVRHPDDATREAACGRLHADTTRIADEGQVTLVWQSVQAQNAVPMDARLAALLQQSIERTGYPAFSLASGAGHDAAVLAQITPAAMLFVRCAGGISHNPAESVDAADVAVAIEVLGGFLTLTTAAAE